MENFEKYVDKMLDGRYHILRVIGVGGMAVVFEAQDIVMNRKVAVKILRDEIAEDKDAVQRFINESQAVSMLSHPNIVKIFDVSVKGDLKYLVMERVDGITLKSYMRKKGALSTEETLSYTEQVLSALEHAHSKGIIHRDIKPQNILLLRNGKVKVTDFGIAKLPDAESTSSDEKAIGTVYYISPEQASGKNIDCRSDLYSTGVLMYEMATGVLPFNSDTPISVAMMQINDAPTPPTQVKEDVPRGLEQIILGAMEKTPERRFQNAEQMLRYVKQLRANPDCIFKTRKKAEENNTSDNNETDMKKKKKKKGFGLLKSSGKESSSMFPIIFGVSVAFFVVLLTVGLSVVNMFMENQNATKSVMITVPDMVMKEYNIDTIGQTFDPSVFKVNIEYSYNAKYGENTVIEQQPAAGSNKKVPRNEKLEVVLTVSKGTELVHVPDYSISDYRTAKIAAERLGFKTEVREVESEVISVGFVVYTEPAARSEAPFGSKLIIYYSKGASPDMVKVPSLVGLTPVSAYRKMNGNFRVGNVEYDYSDKYSKGLIISQSLDGGMINAGDEAQKGSYINFVLSLGPSGNPKPVDPDPSEQTEQGETTAQNTETAGTTSAPSETTAPETTPAQ